MSYLSEYGLFFAKLFTLVIGLLVLFAGIISLSLKQRGQKKEQLTIKKLNEHYDDTTETLNTALLEKKEFKRYLKEKKQAEKQQKKQDTPEKRLFVINFVGDLKASAVENLREEITAILTVARPDDEVFVKVESGGGVVHAYGLAASQLARIRERGILLTVSVDKIAASGGYLMACVANRILAAPFAIIGSIGVLAQLPNFHRFLKKHNVDFEQITSGEFKRTLTMFGENTDKGRKKFQQELNEVHMLFKTFIHEYRPKVELEKVATGEYWLGSHAKTIGLVDELITSDDYLLNANTQQQPIYTIRYTNKPNLKDKISAMMKMMTHHWLGYV